MQDVNLSSEDFYQLRKSQMDADKRVLEAQRAQQELERLWKLWGSPEKGWKAERRRKSSDGSL